MRDQSTVKNLTYVINKKRKSSSVVMSETQKKISIEKRYVVDREASIEGLEAVEEFRALA